MKHVVNGAKGVKGVKGVKGAKGWTKDETFCGVARS
jgi:hypothetical protein